MIDDTEDDDSNRDSYAYCSHFAEQGDCDEPCRCGHKCGSHELWDEGQCGVEGCECKKFEDKL